MKRNSAVIFDCDGVMFDSRQANINFYNHLLAHFDLQPLTEDQVAYVHMHTADESVRLIFEGSPFLECLAGGLRHFRVLRNGGPPGFPIRRIGENSGGGGFTRP